MIQMTSLAKGVVGAVIGAVLGYFAFMFLLKTGFYALALPGFLAGVGATMLTHSKSLPLGILTGTVAFAAGVFAEWKHAPFNADDSLGYFVTHLHQLQWMTWIMLALGTAAAFWYCCGRIPSRSGPARLQD